MLLSIFQTTSYACNAFRIAGREDWREDKNQEQKAEKLKREAHNAKHKADNFSYLSLVHF
jgi:hypothetical protein